MTLLHTQTSETKGGLTSSAVFLGKVNGELMNDVSSVPLESGVETAVAVHYDETKLVIVLQKLIQGLDRLRS